MLEINIIFILPRLVYNNGLLVFNIALLLITILGYSINIIYIKYAQWKNYNSFIGIII